MGGPMTNAARPFALVLAACAVASSGCRSQEAVNQRRSEAIDPIQGQEIAASASAPAVPPPITRTFATKVILEIEIREHVAEIAEGAQYLYWTFGDEAPGKFYRVREGDLVEVHLHNHPDNSLAHNIDFQSATGPGGGGDASFVAPGYSAVFAWRALRPGLYLYQCSAEPAGVHVANGMFGLILVEPRKGLSKVAHEYQIVQSEFYTEGRFGDRGAQRFSADKALKEQPDYVLFNGRVGALTGQQALKASVGERVRIFFGNAGPNLLSSFHVAGEVFDDVYGEGGAVPNQHDVQATAVPPGGSAIVEFGVEVPGDYAVVDHSLFRSHNKGTMGLLTVTGRDNRMIFSGTTVQAVYQPGTQLAKTINFARPETNDGARLFATVCATCHQPGGQGVPKAFPPLRESDFLSADPERAIRIVMSGLKGPITVNGAPYNALMPKLDLTDDQIANVLTYELTELGNKGKPVTLEQVAKVRKAWDGTSTLVADPSWSTRSRPQAGKETKR
jgi:nitrite reductase (NO-forming)